jgi:ferredoxin-NADP reductase
MIQDYEATLTKKTEIAPEIWYYQFTIPEGQTIDFVAGQYMLLKIDTNYRQYSIASADFLHNSFDLLVETIPGGLGSNFLLNLPVGQKAMFKGPAGVFTLKPTHTHKIFLATGTGIAPIKSMIESYFHQEDASATLSLFFGVRTREEVYLAEEFKEFAAKYPNFTFKICLSREESLTGLDEAHYGLGRVNTHLETLLGSQDKNGFEYYICGSKAAVDSLREYVAGLGVNPLNIFFERFTL